MQYTAERFALHLIQRGAAVHISTTDTGRTSIAAAVDGVTTRAEFRDGRFHCGAIKNNGRWTATRCMKGIVDALFSPPLPVVVVVPFQQPEQEFPGMYFGCFTITIAPARWHASAGDLDLDPTLSGFELVENHTWN